MMRARLGQKRGFMRRCRTRLERQQIIGEREGQRG